jgi:hypothetical protein
MTSDSKGGINVQIDDQRADFDRQRNALAREGLATTE